MFKCSIIHTSITKYCVSEALQEKLSEKKYMRLRDAVKSSLSSDYHVVRGLVHGMMQVFLYLEGILFPLKERDLKCT